jgi:hypothetical protein
MISIWRAYIIIIFKYNNTMINLSYFDHKGHLSMAFQSVAENLMSTDLFRSATGWVELHSTAYYGIVLSMKLRLQIVSNIILEHKWYWLFVTILSYDIETYFVILNFAVNLLLCVTTLWALMIEIRQIYHCVIVFKDYYYIRSSIQFRNMLWNVVPLIL